MSEYQEDYSYRYLLISDTKKGLYDSLKALNIKAAKSLRKGELVNMLDDVFTEKPLYIIDRLPKQEQDILSHLVGCKQSEYVELPIAETRLGLEIHHLVVTEVVGDKWRLFMPDSIRKHIDKCAMRDMSIYPGMEEWHKTMEELTKLQQQIEHDVKFNPTVLPIQELPMYIQRLLHELSDLDKLAKRLKSHESQIKQYNIDFNPIYASIEVSRTQCQPKLALMEMFKWG